MLTTVCMYTYTPDGSLRRNYRCLHPSPPGTVKPVSLHAVHRLTTQQATCSSQACVTRTWQGICLLVLHAHVQIACYDVRTGKIGTVSKSDHSKDSEYTRKVLQTLLNSLPIDIAAACLVFRFRSIFMIIPIIPIRTSSLIDSITLRLPGRTMQDPSSTSSSTLQASPLQRHVALTSALC